MKTQLARIWMIGILFSGINSLAQPRMQVSYQENDKGYVILVDNMEYCPVTVDIEFTLKNMTSSAGTKFMAVIPAQTSQYPITEISVDNIERSSRFEYDYRSNLGDHTLTTYQKNYPYQLPFDRSEPVLIMQGYNGRFSHQNKKALDFDLTEGEAVHAARGGTVIRVVTSNNRSCPDESCAQYNNFIIIHHADGTFAEYTHLRRGGSVVREGDQVLDGELIGYSGNTGWSSGPHLHFVAYLQRTDHRETIPTRFLVQRGESAILLKEGESYTKNY